MLEGLTRADEGADGVPLLALTGYADRDAAEAAVLDGAVDAALMVDGDGAPSLIVSPADAGSTDQAIIQTVLDRYLQGEELAGCLAKQDPAALADPAARAALAQNLSGDEASTAELSVLREPPSELSRFYYALLGYACIMCSTVAPNAYRPDAHRRHARGHAPAGGRPAARPPARGGARGELAHRHGEHDARRRLLLLRRWCLLRRQALAHAGSLRGLCPRFVLARRLCGVAPRGAPGSEGRPHHHRHPCTLAPRGALRHAALGLANWLSQHAPIVQLLNPAVQAGEAMLALTFFDSLKPFASACGALLVIAAVLGAGAYIFMRRQRYARA